MLPSWKSRVVRRLEWASAAVGLALVLSARPSTQARDPIPANEATAIVTLRRIAEAQRAFVAAVEIDTNDDGVGEFGYLAELAGAQPMRVSAAGAPAAGAFPYDLLFPPLLRPAFGKVRFSTVVHGGYVFQLWLPVTSVGGKAAGLAEDFDGGKVAAPFPNPQNGAQFWCCYAWPLIHGVTGRRAFVINQDDDVLDYTNRGPSPLSGLSNTPLFDEAFEVGGDMSSPLRIGLAGGALGSTWWPVP